MSYFFDGRLLVTPTVASRVDDSAMDNPNPNVGNILALVGRSVDGQPKAILRFGSPAEARAALVSGELLDAVISAFDPSVETAAPAEVICIRVNPAIQAGLTLLSAASAPVIVLKSTGYGVRANRAATKVEVATGGRGVKVTTQFVGGEYVGDNLFRNAFAISYTGTAETAQIQVANAQIVVSAPVGTPVATVDLNEFKTIQEVADRLNAVANITVQVLDGNGAKAALNGLDTVTAQDIKMAAYTVRADLQAVVDWFNGQGEGFTTATRSANAGALPAPIPFTYLTGGSDGSVTNTDWIDAFEVLQAVDANWVVPVSPLDDIHAMADAHVHYMSSIGRSERRAVVGSELGTTDTEALALAKALNSDRTSLTHLGGVDLNAAGELVMQPPYIIAAKVAGGFCGLNPGEPMTNKSLKLKGVERRLRNPTDTDRLINGGVLCIEDARDGIKVVKSISTWITDDRFSRVEQSTGVALDFTARALRDSVEGVKGRKGSPVTLAWARSQLETTLSILAQPEPIGLAVLVGDADNPAWRNLTVKLTGDTVEVAVEVQPAIGVNYVGITIFAKPYSGTASV